VTQLQNSIILLGFKHFTVFGRFDIVSRTQFINGAKPIAQGLTPVSRLSYAQGR
jgi:hypothetical protein